MHREPMAVYPVWWGRNFVVNRELCFVLMPFREAWSDAIFDYVASTASKKGLVVKRGDSDPGTLVMEDVWRLINEAHLIIADVTNANANVMYELGIVHTLGKPTILLCQDVSKVPFDIQEYRHVIYASDTNAYRTLSAKLPSHIDQILKDSKSGVPVLDEALTKMNLWKLHDYDYEKLLKHGSLRPLRRLLEQGSREDELAAYCLMTFTYYGLNDEALFWISANTTNTTAGLWLARYILMPYLRPKFRALYVLQFLSELARKSAEDYLTKESPMHRLIAVFRGRDVEAYVTNNVNSDPDLDERIGKFLEAEFKMLNAELKPIGGIVQGPTAA